MQPGRRREVRAARATRRRTILFAAVLALLLGLGFTLGMPVRAWRTGEPGLPPLETRPGRPLGPLPLRVWLDTDAACGAGPRTDPDDCFAILLLARSPEVRIAGISTVFGNASIEVTDSITRALVARLAEEGIAPPPVHRGAAAPGGAAGSAEATPAVRALRRALAEAPLVVVTLGPLTNVAAALASDPAAAARVTHLVAVMGRRRGHLFHPVEGGEAGSFLGHGPVFRDFNFAQDERAAEDVVALGLPLSLVPYDAGRDLVLDAASLDRMAARGGADAWVARRARAWLEYWRTDIGRDGFYPFDLVAAAYTVAPASFACADTTVTVGRDPGLMGRLGRRGVFPAVSSGHDDAPAPRARYCPVAGPGVERLLRARGF